MNRRPSKVVVVGGGPAGSACALGLARAGVPEVLVLERSERLVDKACAGGLSPRALGLLGRLGLRAALEPMAVRITGARLVAPDGTERFNAVGLTALVMRRATFDGHLLGEAERAGARVERGVAVDRLLRSGVRVVGAAAGGRDFEAEQVVLAAGAHCRLVWDPRPRTRLDGVIVRYEGAESRPGVVEFVYDHRLRPHYAWLMPELGGTVNVGLCCGHGVAPAPLPRLLDEILADRFPSLARATRIGRPRGHPIVYSGAARYLVSDGVLVVGEAGRLTDGFTGEGIWHALASGLEAAEALAAGEPTRYEWRARLLFDPVLAAAGLMARFGRSEAFTASLKLASTWPVSWVLGKALAGLG